MKISKNKVGISILFLCFYWAGAANASMFTLIGGDDTKFLPGNWNPSNEPSDLSVGDGITVFNEAGEGVWLNGAADLVYTYIGKEAGSTNAFASSSSYFLTEDYMGVPGTDSGTSFATSASSAGYLDFTFLGLGTCCVAPGSFTNGSGSTNDYGFDVNLGLSLAVASISDSALYLMFGDGYGDADFDDMVVKVEAMSAVPVPAAFWLFGTALIGFIGVSRSTKV